MFEIHNAWHHAHHAGNVRLAAAYDRILLIQLETIHRRTSAGLRTSFETLDTLTATLRAGAAQGEIPADAMAHFEDLCRRARLAGTAKTNKGSREELDKVLSRIQALRGKTVDRGCTEAEALLAASKVAELLDQYGLTLSEIDMKTQACAGEGIETSRRRRSPLDECAGTIAMFCDCRSWYEMTPQGHIRHIFFGLPADVAGARYLYEKIDEAFDTETAAFKRSELYEAHPSRPAPHRHVVVPGGPRPGHPHQAAQAQGRTQRRRPRQRRPGFGARQAGRHRGRAGGHGHAAQVIARQPQEAPGHGLREGPRHRRKPGVG